MLDFLDPDGDGTGTAQALKTRYFFGPNVDQILAQEDAGTNAVLWQLGDHLGTVRDVIESDGDLADHVVYDSFGRATSESEPSTDRLFGFTGRAFDSETGLQNNWHRWYDANTGNWISEDSIGFRARDTNLARYAENGPEARRDSTGLDWWNDSGWDWFNPFAYAASFGNAIGSIGGVDNEDDFVRQIRCKESRLRGTEAEDFRRNQLTGLKRLSSEYGHSWKSKAKSRPQLPEWQCQAAAFPAAPHLKPVKVRRLKIRILQKRDRQSQTQ